LPLKIAVDSVLGNDALPHFLAVLLPESASGQLYGPLMVAAGLLLVIGAIVHLQGLAVWYLQTYTGEKLVLDFRSDLFRHVQRLSLTFHNAKPTGDTIYRIREDAACIQYIAIQGLIPLISAVVALLGIFIVTARLDWRLAMVGLSVSPILALLSALCSKEVRKRWSKIKNLDSSAMSVMHEVMSSVQVVKAFGQEAREEKRFVQASSQRMRSQVKLALVQGGFHLLVGLTIAIGTAFALYLGVNHVRAGVITTGELLVVMAYLAQLYEPLKTLSTKFPEIQGWMTSASRAFSLFDENAELLETTSGMPLPRATGRIQFENVSFAYRTNPEGSGAGNQVLENVSFDIPPGTKVGIIGPTGAGKTTVLGLLMRFYDPTSGRVLLDGTDARAYRLSDLRRQFALVLQDPLMFSASVAENIAYAEPQATPAQIVAAAKAAHAHEFITMLPEGYNTQVGERGAMLSGGQRQRLALARCFLKDTPFLVLDEPTSAVDVKTEELIMQATEELMKGRTTFMIAHRLSTLKNCDLILLFENGKLIAQTADVKSAVGQLLNGSGTPPAAEKTASAKA